jgi:hypothetical protein
MAGFDEIKKELQIPDLWFDFYARLVPGVAFASALRFFVLFDKSVPSWNEIAGIAAGGFFCALLTQAVASRLTGKIESMVERLKKVDELHIATIQRMLGSSSRKAMILSKMHGEVTCFVQLGILSVIFLLISIVKNLGWHVQTGVGVLILLSFGSAFEVADRRLKKALRYKETLDKVPHDGKHPAIVE